MGFCRVPERVDQRVTIQRRLDEASLGAGAAAMNQPDFAKSGGVCLGHVFLDDRPNIPWRERVKVEGALDRYMVRRIGVTLRSCHACVSSRGVDAPPREEICGDE